MGMLDEVGNRMQVKDANLCPLFIWSDLGDRHGIEVR